jgi:hypothetical protein
VLLLDVGAGAALSECHPQGIEDEVGAHISRELPADDHPTEGVESPAKGSVIGKNLSSSSCVVRFA